MNNAHKIAVLVLSFALLAAVSACGKQKENPDLLNDQITALTETAEETTEETTETSTETTTYSTLGSETTDTTATAVVTAPSAPVSTPLRTIPAPTPAPKQTAAPAPATTAAPAPATAAATTVVPVPAQATQPAPGATETPIGPGDPIELPLVPGETTTVAVPGAAETPITPAGDPANPPMPNLSANVVDENSGKLTANGTDLYIGGNVSAFISVNPPLRQHEDPNPRFVNGQQVNCVEYSYTDYVIVCNAADNSVLYIDMSGSAIQTSKGIHVGSTVDEVTAAYGAGQTYTFGSNTLSFNFRDGIVNMITIGVQ